MDKTRDDLIQDVEYGRLTPQEAEAEARRRGFEPFERSPDPKKYDPLGEDWWTLVMVLAWIARRDIQSVRDVFDPYRQECFDWHFRKWRLGFDGPIHKGYFLKSRGLGTISFLSFSQSYQAASDGLGEHELAISEAREQLWGALKAGQLQATGRPSGGGPRVLIPDYEWTDLEDVEENGRDVLRDGKLSARGYSDVTFRRFAVMGLWHERPSTSILELVPTISPQGPGYFALYCAAHWIATEGGKKTFDPSAPANWRPAYAELTSRIASGQVAVIGIRNGLPEKIEGHIFASVRVDYPYGETPLELIFSEQLYLCSYPYLDEEHWQKGFDDSLQTRSGPHWSKLMVLKSDILNHWPYSPDDGHLIAKGAPGRPTPMHLVSAEHERRILDRQIESGVTAEATVLAEWLKQTHPAAPSLTAKTIANNIRDRHRQAQQANKGSNARN